MSRRWLKTHISIKVLIPTLLMAASLRALTVEEAIESALAHNRNIQVAGSEVKRTQRQYRAAFTQRLAQFNVLANRGVLLTQPKFFFPAGPLGQLASGEAIPANNTTIRAPRQLSAFLFEQANQPLTQQYRIGLLSKSAALATSIAKEGQRQSQQETINQVRKTYFAIVSAESQTLAAGENVRLIRELDRLVGERVALRTALEAERLDVRSRLAQAEYEATVPRNQAADAKEQLNILMGRPVDAVVEVSELQDKPVSAPDGEAARRAGLSSPGRAQTTPPSQSGKGQRVNRTDEALAPESQSQQSDSPHPLTDTRTAIDVALQVQAGIYSNPRTSDGLNFGQLFTDRANDPQLNQILLTVSKAPKGKPGGYAVGFNFQALYGSDGRLATILGITDNWINARKQIAITQANVAAHLPWSTSSGVEVKAGILTGAMGLESFDPSKRPFYTFSYLSNFLLPFQHVGAIATVHLSPNVSFFGQIDGGNSVSIGRGDPNGTPAGYLGVVLNGIAEGKVSVFATTRVGPELPRSLFPDAGRRMKYWNDLSILYDPTDDLSISLEANYQYDKGLRAAGYALMSFATYKINPQLSVSARAEAYRDETGQLTVGFLDNEGYTRALAGKPTRIAAAPPTTYGSLTAGLTIKPKALQRLASIAIRPEVRYDRSLNGTRPFNNLRDKDAFMFGMDLIIGL